METSLIAFLDKTWPPDHSFVNGMLAREVPNEPGIRAYLCVSKGATRPYRARRYGQSMCLPVLFPRAGFGRVRNLPMAMRLIFYFSQRERRAGRRVVIFVRNDPVYLLAGALMSAFVDKLIYQSSFPHEEYSGGIAKRLVSKALLKLSSPYVSSILAVSPLGLSRLSRAFPRADAAAWIPLLSDFKQAAPDTVSCDPRTPKPDVVFLYIGTHDPSRMLDAVLAAIADAVKQGARARFIFVGGNAGEIDGLREVSGVPELEASGLLEFRSFVPRSSVPGLLREADVGLCLIPPNEMYQESSPTKLAEYMGAGLAVLASSGIPLQEQMINASEGGWLATWDKSSIIETIFKVVQGREELESRKNQAFRYATKELQYSCYLPQIRQLIF